MSHSQGSHAAKPHAAEAHASAAPSAAPSGGSTFEKVRGHTDQAAAKVRQSANVANTTLRSWLRFDTQPPTEASWLATPFKSAGHVIDGTILNIGRRIAEVLEPVGSAVGAAWDSTAGVILHPLDTLTQLKFIKAPIRLITSSTLAAVNMVLSPLRTGHEVLDRSIYRSINQITLKTHEKVRKVIDFVPKTVSGITGWTRNLIERVLTPITWLHAKSAPA